MLQIVVLSAESDMALLPRVEPLLGAPLSALLDRFDSLFAQPKYPKSWQTLYDAVMSD